MAPAATGIDIPGQDTHNVSMVETRAAPLSQNGYGLPGFDRFEVRHEGSESRPFRDHALAPPRRRRAQDRGGIPVMTDSDAVLSQNLEFYRAFSTRDISGMERLWARQAPVSCLHPGWRLITGREEVMRSWRAILRNPGAPAVLCYEERATLYGDTALVTCEEELAGGALAASNLFIREGGLWRLVYHQSTPVQEQRAPARPVRRAT